MDFLKAEYDGAKVERQYYAELINKQDASFNAFFAIFSIVMTLIYNAIQINNKDVFLENLLLSVDQKIIISAMCLLIGVLYIYLFVALSSSVYYLILFGEKIAVLEKVLNIYLGKELFVWETYIMSRLQSKDNVHSAGFLNVNYFKFVFVVILYLIVEAFISVVLCYTVKTVAYLFVPVVALITLIVFCNWIMMYWKFPEYCKKTMEVLYEDKLGIMLNQTNTN